MLVIYLGENLEPRDLPHQPSRGRHRSWHSATSSGKWGEVVAPVRVPGVLSRYIVDTESHGFVGFSTQRFTNNPDSRYQQALFAIERKPKVDIDTVRQADLIESQND